MSNMMGFSQEDPFKTKNIKNYIFFGQFCLFCSPTLGHRHLPSFPLRNHPEYQIPRIKENKIADLQISKSPTGPTKKSG